MLLGVNVHDDQKPWAHSWPSLSSMCTGMHKHNTLMYALPTPKTHTHTQSKCKFLLNTRIKPNHNRVISFPFTDE